MVLQDHQNTKILGRKSAFEEAILARHELIGQAINTNNPDLEFSRYITQKEKRRKTSILEGMKSLQSLSPKVAPSQEHPIVADSMSGSFSATRRNLLLGATPDEVKSYFQNASENKSSLQKKVKDLDNADKPKYCIHPHGKFRLRWDITSVLFIAYNATIIPFQVGFFDSDVDDPLWIQVIDRVIDAFFIMDLALNFVTGIERGGKTTYDRRVIAMSYLKSWLIIDIVSAMPLSMIARMFSGHSESLSTNLLEKSLKLFRLIRLFRVFRIIRILNRLEYALLIRSTISTISKFSIVVAITSHWLSCIFFALASYQREAVNWADANGLFKPGTTIMEQYCTSLYWSIMTITTVGYGDVSAQNTSERLFSCVAMIIGAGIFAYGITNIVSLVSNLTAEETEFREKMDQVNEYMEARSLPNSLRREIREFIHNSRKSKESLLSGENDILNELSSMLRSKIALAINDHFLKKMPFFVGSDPNFLLELSLSMRMICFAPFENIVLEGEIGNEMFFIFRGGVEVIQHSKTIVLLGENQYFGELAILNPDCKRTATVRTLCFCELRVLSRENFLEALTHFPAMRKRMTQFASARKENDSSRRENSLARKVNSFKIDNGTSDNSEISYVNHQPLFPQINTEPTVNDSNVSTSSFRLHRLAGTKISSGHWKSRASFQLKPKKTALEMISQLRQCQVDTMKKLEHLQDAIDRVELLHT